MTGESGPVFLVVGEGHRSLGVIWAWPWTQGAQATCRERPVLTPGEAPSWACGLQRTEAAGCWVGSEQGK